MRISSIKGVKKVTASLIVAVLISMLGVNVAIAHGAVDQSNTPQSPTGWLEPSDTWVWGQIFIPQEDNIVSVDLDFYNLSGLNATRTFTVSIRESSGDPEFNGTILDSVTQEVSIPALTEKTVHFDFPSTIYLVAGNTYVIEVKAVYYDEVDLVIVYGGQNSYLEGMVILALEPMPTVSYPYPDLDLGFTTYFEEGISNKGDILKNSGVPGEGIDDAPGLQKEFNEKSKAGENAGKKK